MKIETFEAWNTKTFKDLKSIKRLVEDRHYYTSLEYCFNEKQKEIQSLKEKLKEAEKENEHLSEEITELKDDLSAAIFSNKQLLKDEGETVRAWLTQNNQAKGE